MYAPIDDVKADSKLSKSGPPELPMNPALVDDDDDVAPSKCVRGGAAARAICMCWLGRRRRGMRAASAGARPGDTVHGAGRRGSVVVRVQQQPDVDAAPLDMFIACSRSLNHTKNYKIFCNMLYGHCHTFKNL